MAKYNRQLITPYDVITRSDVVMTQIDPVTITTQQPAGYIADLTTNPLSWTVSYQGNVIGTKIASEKELRDFIVEYHNRKEIAGREDAVAWVKYYLNHPEAKRGVNPQLIESIYKSAARARLHPDDKKQRSGVPTAANGVA